MIKSYAGIGFQQCPVCLKKHSDSVLLNKNFRNVFGPAPVCTGHSLCPEHKALADKDFVFLVAVSNAGKQNSLKPENAIRTGEIAAVKLHVLEHIFTDFSKPKGFPVVFADADVMDYLRALQEQAQE